MNNIYFDLPKRLEKMFAEIDNDIVTDLRKTNKEYAELQQQLSDLKKAHLFIMQVMEGTCKIYLTAEEHTVFLQYLGLVQKLDDMERLQIYFRGHTDAVSYLKKIGAI